MFNGGLLKICHILGMIPANSKLPAMIYVTSLFISVIIWNLYCLFLRFEVYGTLIASTATWMLDLLLLLINLTFQISLYGLPHGRKNWRDLIYYLGRIEKKFYGKPAKFRLFRLSRKAVTAFLLNLITISALMSISRYNFTLKLIISSSYVIQIYKTTSISLMEYFLETLARLYKLLGNRLNVKFLQYDERKILKDLEDIGSIYEYLYRTTEKFNEMFGWLIFLNLQGLVIKFLAILSSLTYHLKHLFDAPDIKWLIFSTTDISCSAILTLMIVMPSDAIEVHSQTLDEICHELILNKFSNSPLRKEFLDLSQSFKILAPEISAAGFFTVNRRVLLGLASIVTTYFIVYLQFK